MNYVIKKIYFLILSLFIDIYAINCDKSSTKYITYQIESSLYLVGEDTLRERILFDILA